MGRMSGVILALALSLLAPVYAQQDPKRPTSEPVTQSTVAQRRVALVIGNKDYSLGNLGKLKNPVNDADDVAAELINLGSKLL